MKRNWSHISLRKWLEELAYVYNVSGVSGMDAISEEETRMGHGDSPPVSSQHPVAVRDTPHTVSDTPHTVTKGTQILVILGC